MRWLAETQNRRMVGRGIALLFAGLLFAGAIINSQESDKKRAQQLTRERYDKDFESYRAKLIQRADTPAFDVIVFVIFAGISFAALEGAGIVIGVSVGTADEALERRRARRRSVVMDDTDE